VTLLYTHNLGGDLDLLPRLNTFLSSLRGAQRPLLIDIGSYCSPDVWHCRVTGGRSMLIALDAMGYTAVNAEEVPEEERARLESLVNMALVDTRYTHVEGDLVFSLAAGTGDGHLRVSLTPSPRTALSEQVLTLEGLEKGQVGVVRIAVRADYMLSEAKIHSLPPDIPPDPSITSVVEFITAEARSYQRRHGDDD
jgi:hypothetical protein